MAEKTTAIAKTPIYSQLSSTGQKLLDSKTQYVDCKSSDTIIIQGQKASGAYIVLEGQLRVYSVSPKGNQATMYTIDPGETCVLALNCLFNDLVYPAWVDAEVNSKVAIIPGPAFRSLFAYEPSIQDLTVRTLSTLVFRLMDELGDVHGLTHSQRLAGFLLTRASESGELKITQQQIADHLGTRREVIARLLLEFVDNGWIKTGRGNIQVLDMEQLRAITQS
jgi:CRP/FNR family transcriptional regulator, anaerobic regulatory protein